MSTEIIKKYTCDNEANSSCVKKLSSLSLRRLILPTNIKLTRSNLVRSYTLELPREDSDSYSQLNTQLLINELRAVRADFSKLSGSDLIFDKISPDNVMIADNKIFLYDYTKLMLASDIDYARTYNNVKLNELFGHALLVREYPDMLRFNTIDKFYSNFLLTNHENFEDFVEAEVKEESLAKHLAKRY